mmetsp:Transcript_47459/g.70275  ORF Transcript_47459/g.70275 Transcript_47459/m.70275 type:complete len:99 (+) Transcript_47459:632-928(+)
MMYKIENLEGWGEFPLMHEIRKSEDFSLFMEARMMYMHILTTHYQYMCVSAHTKIEKLSIFEEGLECTHAYSKHNYPTAVHSGLPPILFLGWLVCAKN